MMKDIEIDLLNATMMKKVEDLNIKDHQEDTMMLHLREKRAKTENMVIEVAEAEEKEVNSKDQEVDTKDLEVDTKDQEVDTRDQEVDTRAVIGSPLKDTTMRDL